MLWSVALGRPGFWPQRIMDIREGRLRMDERRDTLHRTCMDGCGGSRQNRFPPLPSVKHRGEPVDIYLTSLVLTCVLALAYASTC